MTKIFLIISFWSSAVKSAAALTLNPAGTSNSTPLFIWYAGNFSLKSAATAFSFCSLLRFWNFIFVSIAIDYNNGLLKVCEKGINKVEGTIVLMAASIHEARAFITNLRNHLHSDFGDKKWRTAVLLDAGEILGYLGALEMDGKMDDDDMEKIRQMIQKIQRAAEDNERSKAYGLFLNLNTILIKELNIPPII